MAWRIDVERSAERELAGLGQDAAKRVLKFLRERVALADDPRATGSALKGPRLGALWKYRVGDYRVIASIDDDAATITVLRIGHRRDVYRR